MDYQAHWQALYDAMRTGLDDASHTDVGLYHVFTGDDSPLLTSAEPPLVAYRQDVERTLGTWGDGSLAVLRSNWVITAWDTDLENSLSYVSTIVNALTDAALTTTDGYTTTALRPLGVQSLYETDAALYAVHLRMEWERSL